MADTYRYFLSIKGDTFGCSPIGNVSFKWDRDNAGYFYRQKLASGLTFKGADYAALFAVERSIDRCIPIGFLIERYNAGGYAPYWKGKFSVSNATWNLDKCSLSVNILPDDAYTLLLEEYEQEENLLLLEQTYSVRLQLDLTTTYEFATSDYTRTGEEGREADFYSLFLWHKYREPNNRGTGTREVKKYVYFREISFTSVEDVDEEGQELPPPGSGWNLVNEDASQLKWARLPQIEGYIAPEIRELDISRVEYPVIEFRNCDVELPEGYLLASPCSFWFPMGDKQVFWQQGVYRFNRARKLIECLSYLVKLINPSLLLEDNLIASTILRNEQDPIFGDKNPLWQSMLLQKSDVIKYRSSEPATRAMVSLKAILEDLRNMANLYWHINKEGKFELEHLSFFEDRESDIDTTLERYKSNKYKRVYSYQNAKMPRYEKLTFSEDVSDLFQQSVIEYEGSCINKEEGENTVTYSVTKFTNDVENIILAPNEFSLTGFVLLSVDTTPSGFVNIITKEPTYRYAVKRETDPQEGRTVPNVPLSAHRLMERYYRYGRVLRTGKINKVPFKFYSVVRLKKQ